jgi:hypothetical protein
MLRPRAQPGDRPGLGAWLAAVVVLEDVPEELFPVTALPTAAPPRATAATTTTVCTVRFMLSDIVLPPFSWVVSRQQQETSAAWEAAQENM